MPTYAFRYKKEGSMPFTNLVATDNEDFYRQLAQFELDCNVKHVPDTIYRTISETMRVPEPPAPEEPRDPFSSAEEAIANRIGI